MSGKWVDPEYSLGFADNEWVVMQRGGNHYQDHEGLSWFVIARCGRTNKDRAEKIVTALGGHIPRPRSM